ncbi:MAG: hypothetical protein H0V01_15270 [Bacteroidetes bacterium]|nr:hypothetical protein [Bacteroidota bacterium]HET6244401.1 alpha-2-macroglobulin family protein [Bacteroidia bacterium]
MRLRLKTTTVVLILFAVVSALSFNSFHNSENIIYPKWNNYEELWLNVDSLRKKGMNNTALQVTDEIYARAKNEKNAPQIIKALLHRASISSLFEEEADEKSIAFILNELKEINGPAKPILHSILAEMYWKYYQNNRYRFLDRSHIADAENSDLRTWDLIKIHQVAVMHYEKSLLNADTLKRTQLNIFDPIIINGDTLAKKLRPTLYDFLAHRAIDFYSHEETDLALPAWHFQINDSAAFLPYKYFIDHKFQIKDTGSVKLKALILLQNVLDFHKNDSVPNALIDADIKRLKFSQSNANLVEKDSLYLEGLNNLYLKFSNYSASSEITYEIAYYHFFKGNTYEPFTNPSFQFNKQKAIELCEKEIKKFPSSFGAKKCSNLKTIIKEKSLSVTLEKTVAVNSQFPALLTFKNIDTVYVKIVSVLNENNIRRNYNYNDGNIVKEMLKQKVVEQFSIQPPQDQDYQQHSLEMAMPKLNSGQFCVLVSNNKDFNFDKHIVAYSFLWVTDISHMERKTSEGGYDVFVMNRNSGNPIKGAVVKSWIEKYDYKTRKYELEESGKFLTDEKGFIHIPISKEHRNFYLEIIKDKDKIFNDQGIYQYRSSIIDVPTKLKTWFFTDRSIYRPGQTVFFKGILIETKGDSNHIKTNHPTVVTLYDVNYQKVSDLKLVTNEYGSFSGSFTLPSAGLTGNMHIKNESGSFHFSVEEYKRPKFEVTFLPIKGAYKPGDKIKANAVAKAYSGAAIDGAEAKYRVIRNAVFPKWWYQREAFSTDRQVEITQGIVQTNRQGEFEIEFIAVPGDAHFSETRPLFYTYTIFVDVTDISGETRGAEKTIPVGYTSLILDATVSTLVDKNHPVAFIFKTTNLEGQPQAAKVSIEISRLENQERVLKERLWKRPDKFLLSKKEFIAIFPNDEYNNENDLEQRKIDEMVHKSTLYTLKEKELKLNQIKEWKSGTYLIEALVTDDSGNEIKEKYFFTLFSKLDKSPPFNSPFFFQALTNKVEPGDKASFLIGSKQQITMLFEIEHKNKIVKREWHTLNNEQKIIEIPIEEKHRGNFTIHVVAIKNNRGYSFAHTIFVPYTNKELQMEFETFRDKLQPGQKEEWKIKIKGKTGDKIAAEMVASLYDASLDAFKPHQWNFNIYPGYFPTLGWQKSLSFGIVSTSSYSHKYEFPEQIYRKYDELNWFDNNESTRYSNKQILMSQGLNMNTLSKDGDGIEIAEQSQTYSKKNASDKEMNNPPAGNKSKTSEEKSGTEKLAADKEFKTRSNFNETAFFFPHLTTDENGTVIVNFILPESITKWKFLGFTHTLDLRFAQIEKEFVAQKELMISPVVPRFLREGDEMLLSASVVNITDKEKKGKAKLELLHPVSRKIISDFKNENPEIDFMVSATSSTNVKWKINIPQGFQTVLIRITAKAGNYTDGEEIIIPVLPNKILVTESLPLFVRGKQSKDFSFEKLLNQKSPTLKNHRLTLEFTSNPVWYAVQALPYLMEFPFECSEQIFGRYYSNAIAAHIANSNPKIKAVFEQWKNYNHDVHLSALEKNSELKNILLEETPWVLESNNEQERKKRIGLLFDLNKMANERTRAELQLIKMQTPNGGFPWFPGMKDDRYLTQYITSGYGRLHNLGIKNSSENKTLNNAIEKAIEYLDERINEDYEKLFINKTDTSKKQITALQIHYFYARSFYSDYPHKAKNKKAYTYFYKQMKKHLATESLYLQAMCALSISRLGENNLSIQIVKSIKDNAIFNEEMGMYWKDNIPGFNWHQAPIETQALFIEAFGEITKDKNAVDEMQIWLLKQKQTQNWNTTKATAEACYALLLQGNNLIEKDPEIKISLGIHSFNSSEINNKETGTGYFKKSWNDDEITKDLGKINVNKKSDGISWGAVYWQYFEQLDKIKPHKTPLKINKKLFLETPTSSGMQITPIIENTNLKPGDRIIVRIELSVDRAMEYVHLKDLRASTLEPENVLSQYKFRDGLGYYESTRDASTNFFFSHLPKGTFIFEYPLRITHFGNFSAGIATVQCMYAPEFTSHSEGVKLIIKEK